MYPTSPVLEGFDVVVYAKDQPEYNPLPAIRSEDGCVTTRWRLSLKERIRVFFYGNVYLQVMTFNQKLQPVKLTIEPPETL